jgi:hypothetical protein
MVHINQWWWYVHVFFKPQKVNEVFFEPPKKNLKISSLHHIFHFNFFPISFIYLFIFPPFPSTQIFFKNEYSLNIFSNLHVHHKILFFWKWLVFLKWGKNLE